MASTNPNVPLGFREMFDSAREATVALLVAEIAGADEVTCSPLDGYGMFGWQFEATDPQFANQTRGDAAYGCAYLRHMINQGFKVGFCVWLRGKRALVCLKTWEPGEDEPAWPQSPEGATVVYHKYPAFSRDT